MERPHTISEALEHDVREGVQSATVDGSSTTAIDVSKRIEADRYLAAQRAASSPLAGVKVSRIVPGGYL